MPGGFKGTAFRKNRMGGLYACLVWTVKKLNFLVIFKTKTANAHTENTLNGEISTESVYCISQLIIIKILKQFSFFLSTLYGID